MSGPAGRFAEVIRRGKRHASTRLTLCVLDVGDVQCTAGAPPGAAAWSIQKKFAKSAVLRNTIKRQLREAVRLRGIPPAKQLVFLGRRPFVGDGVTKHQLKQVIRREAEGLLDRVCPRP